ncbi:hypothetical protein TH8_19650 [Thalassospira profundimaris]|nr:hypothetical protein TH8_19650 [Thalassospira profundimaris]
MLVWMMAAGTPPQSFVGAIAGNVIGAIIMVMVSRVLPEPCTIRVGEVRFFGSFVDLQKG